MRSRSIPEAEPGTRINITRVRLADGTWMDLEDYPCDCCGKKSSPYIALSDQGTWAFCSGECRDEAIRANGEKITPELMEASGLKYIGPKPQA